MRSSLRSQAPDAEQPLAAERSEMAAAPPSTALGREAAYGNAAAQELVLGQAASAPAEREAQSGRKDAPALNGDGGDAPNGRPVDGAADAGGGLKRRAVGAPPGDAAAATPLGAPGALSEAGARRAPLSGADPQQAVGLPGGPAGSRGAQAGGARRAQGDGPLTDGAPGQAAALRASTAGPAGPAAPSAEEAAAEVAAPSAEEAAAAADVAAPSPEEAAAAADVASPSAEEAPAEPAAPSAEEAPAGPAGPAAAGPAAAPAGPAAPGPAAASPEAAGGGDAARTAAPRAKALQAAAAGGGGGGGGGGGATLAFAPPAPATDPAVEEIWTLVTGASPTQTTDASNARLQELDAFVHAGQAALDVSGSDAEAQIDGLINERVGRLDAAFEGAISQVQGRIQTLRAGLAGACEQGAAQISASAQLARANLDASLAAQLAAVNDGFSGAEEQLSALQGDATDAFQSAVLDRVSAIRAAGEASANACLSAAAGMAAGWQGGEGVEADRNRARVDAATQVSSKYAEEVRSKAEQAAQELSQCAGQASAMAQELVQPVATQLATTRAQAQEGLQLAAASARSEVDARASAATTELGQLRSQLDAGLVGQEQRSLAALGEAHGTARANLLASGEALKEEVRGASTTFQEASAGLLAQASAELAGQDVPQQDRAELVIAEVQAEIDLAQTEQQQALEAVAGRAVATLDTNLADAIGGMQSAVQAQLAEAEATAQSARASVSSLTSQVTSALSGLVSERSAALAEQAGQATQSAQTAVTGAQSSLTTALAQWEGDLDASKASVEAELSTAESSCGAEISTTAQAAASKIEEKSWLERAWDVIASAASFIVGVVVGLVVFVVVAAFCIATFGIGTVALIAAGAIATGFAAATGMFANDATKSLLTWENQFRSLQEYGKVAVVGLVTGALAPVAAGMSVFAGISLIGVSSGLTEQLYDMAFGESWDSLEFAVAVVTSLGVGAIFAKVPGVRDLGSKLVSRLFPPIGKGGSWNSFNSWFAKFIPQAKSLDNTGRGILWRKLVKPKIEDEPAESVEEEIREVVDPLLEDESSTD